MTDNPNRPLDPTKSGEDFLGDTTGLTGVTTGSAQQTSATPNDQQKDENKDHLPGGILEPGPVDETMASIPKEATDENEYAANTIKGMSDEKSDTAADSADESDDDLHQHPMAKIEPEAQNGETVNVGEAMGDDSPGSDNLNTATAGYSQPEHKGEQSVSGSAPDPTADDDTLRSAHAVGTQLDEDEEHPKELNLGADIDKAEEAVRNG